MNYKHCEIFVSMIGNEALTIRGQACIKKTSDKWDVSIMMTAIFHVGFWRTEILGPRKILYNL